MNANFNETMQNQPERVPIFGVGHFFQMTERQAMVHTMVQQFLKQILDFWEVRHFWNDP